MAVASLPLSGPESAFRIKQQRVSERTITVQVLISLKRERVSTEKMKYFILYIPPQNPKLRGGGFGLYIRLLSVGHLRNLARSSTNRDGFASKILESGP